MDWFLYDNGLRHERVKLLLCMFPREIFQFLAVLLRSYYYCENHFDKSRQVSESRYKQCGVTAEKIIMDKI